jgi:hypothetical protein
MALAGAALASAPGPAAATEGGLYPFNNSVWAVHSPFTATVLGGPTWQIQAPVLSPAAIGDVWEMNWSCPVAGSEVAAVLFDALRTQAASSLEVRVTGNRIVLWAEADGAMPQSPAPGRSYDVRLPGGQCNIHLMLTQVEQRVQHARGYFIANPRLLLRDLTAPAVAMQGLSPGWLGATAALHAAWNVTDNFGNDGVGQQRVAVGGEVRWAGAPGVGSHAVDLALDGVPDGVQRVEITADGDGTGPGGADGTISVDRTAPTAADLTSSSPGAPGVVAVAWRAADNLSGVASTQAEVNVSTDGGQGGSWSPFAAAVGPGDHSAAAAPAVADGVHAWRVRTADAAGNVALTPGPAALVVDTRPPALELHDIPSIWVNRLDVDLTATDNLQSVLGLGATEIDVNAAADGGDSGEWLRRSTTTGPPGRRVIPLSLAGLGAGRHAVRVTARNGGPQGASLVTEVRAALRVDLESPAISRAAFSPAGGRPMTVAWTADDAHSGVAAATVQWRDGGAWRTLASERATDGAGSMVIDVSALPSGEQAMRVVVADAAGNTAAKAGTTEITAGGVGSIAANPLGRLRRARLSLSLAGAHVERRGSRRVLVRRLSSGGTVAIRGALMDRAERGIVGAEVQARGHRGRLVGRGLTHRGGRFAFTLRPLAGGIVRVGVAAGRELLPRIASADVRLEVRPRLQLSASATVVPTGTPVLFSGRLAPSPGDLGFGARKGVVLEWLDPVRRTWRPVVNARLRGDGTFAVLWAYGVRGLTIPMRVTVPQEVGWPLLPARSRVIRVRVA